MTNDSQRETLQKYKFKFNKRFGQNFISDKNLLSAIVADAGITGSDTVVEVGAGAGALTLELARVANKVVSYEIDTALTDVLNDRLDGIQNAELVFADVMKESADEILARTGGVFKVVANLPYYITTPIIFKFLDLPVQSITVLVQKEVAYRMCASAGTAEYGVLTVGIAVFGTAKITRQVKRQMFYPVPDVDSALVTIVPDNRLDKSTRSELKELARLAFAMRRKTLYNNLKGKYGAERAARAIESAGLPADVRGEMLTLDNFIELNKQLKKL